MKSPTEEKSMSAVRRYSLADLDAIDFSTSDDFALVVEKLKGLIIMRKPITDMWTEEHEQNLWQYVIDPDSILFICYTEDQKLVSSFALPCNPVKDLFYLIKTVNDSLYSHDYDVKIMFGTSNAPYFESLYDILFKVFFPLFRKNTDWSKCIKTDYLQHQAKFSAYLFNLWNEFSHELNFYVPEGIVSLSVHKITENRELLIEVERTAITWIWLLMSYLMKQANVLDKNSGLSEEIEFWTYKLDSLNKAQDQFNRLDVQKCIEVLKVEKSGCYEKLMLVCQQMMDELDLTRENIKFLSILQKPCELIQTADFEDIPHHLNMLLNFVKIIWANSSFYSKSGEITSLFSKVNNFIISTLSSYLPLQEIFSHESFENEIQIQKVIQCCNAWVDIFHTSEEAHKRYANRVWAVEPVAPLINLFIQRCENLIKILNYKIQFRSEFNIKDYVRGYKCYDIAKQLDEIENYFFTLLRNLSAFQNSCVDIYSTVWNDKFKKFLREIQDLELVAAKILPSVFDKKVGILEGIQIISMFQKYFFKEVFKRDLIKYVKMLYDLFFKEVSFVKKKLFASKARGNYFLLPYYGGRAFYAFNLLTKLKQDYYTLKKASLMWPAECRMELDDQFQQIKASIFDWNHSLFLQWTKRIPKDPYNWLKEAMIVKVESSHFIKANIDRNIIMLLEELYYWDKTGVEIPFQVAKLLEKSDLYSKRIQRILQSVAIYNHTILSLSTDDKMFHEVLVSLEAACLPLLLDLNWSSPQPSMNASLNVLAEQTKSVSSVFAAFEENMEKILNLCQKITGISLFSGDIKIPVTLMEFLQTEETHRKCQLAEINNFCQEILLIAKKILQFFSKKLLGNKNHTASLVDLVAAYISDSLKESFILSLNSIASLFGIKRENQTKIFLKISLLLKDNQLVFDPTFKEICYAVESLIDTISSETGGLISTEEFFEKNIVQKNYKQLLLESDAVKETQKEIDYGLYELYEAEKNYIDEWKLFSFLWEIDKAAIVKRYEEEGWRASSYEKDINEYFQTAQKIPHIPRYKSLEYCVCDCGELKQSAIISAEHWKNELGSIFRKFSCSNLQTAYNLLELTAKKFSHVPSTLKDLKHCINFLIRSKASSIALQSTFESIHDIFAALKKFNVFVDDEFLEQEQNLEENWKLLQNNFQEYYVKLQEVQAHHLRRILEYHKTIKRRVNSLQHDLEANGPFDLSWDIAKAVHQVVLFKQALAAEKEREFVMKKDAVFFNLDLEPLDIIRSLDNELDDLRKAWIYAEEVDSYINQWGSIPLISFNVDEKREIFENYKNSIEKLLQGVEGNHWVLLSELQSKLKDVDELFHIILNFQEPSLQERHWNDFKNALEIPSDKSINFFQSSDFSFNFLQNIKVDNLREKTDIISLQAKKEFEIEKSLIKTQDQWQTVLFELSDYKTSFKVKDSGKIVAVVEDHQLSLEKMKASKYVPYFSQQIDVLENSLCLILDVIDQAENFQSKFFFLENIFSQQTIQAQLPKEAVDFQEVSSQWNNVAQIVKHEKVVWDICHKEGFLETLVEMNEVIESVQKSLETFLESKRKTFPRFYFISDDDLLAIIGQDSPLAIQTQLKKCFDGLCKLEILEEADEKLKPPEILEKACGMHSNSGEYVEFVSSVTLDGPVEYWMLEIEQTMYATLVALLPKCFQILLKHLSKEDFNFTDVKWLQNWPGQLCMLALQIAWTAEASAAIKSVQDNAITTPLKSLKKKWREILNQFIKKQVNASEHLMQLKNMMVITALVHIGDISDTLIKFVCNDPNAFEWLVQLRYYYAEDKKDCFVHQTRVVLKYGFEYLGNRERLVITPLTDRCFTSITSALLLHQGVIMKGSKSAGKTETLKELGKTLGNYVLVINCSENLTHFSLIRMLSGLAQIGAWGLFEEFNNVNAEIISVLSQQIKVIFQSLAQKQNYFSFMGTETPLQERCGIYLGINPSFSALGYSLPSTLSELFRPVTMICPDMLVIIKVYLLANGFQECKVCFHCISNILPLFHHAL